MGRHVRLEVFHCIPDLPWKRYLIGPKPHVSPVDLLIFGVFPTPQISLHNLHSWNTRIWTFQKSVANKMISLTKIEGTGLGRSIFLKRRLIGYILLSIKLGNRWNDGIYKHVKYVGNSSTDVSSHQFSMTWLSKGCMLGRVDGCQCQWFWMLQITYSRFISAFST